MSSTPAERLQKRRLTVDVARQLIDKREKRSKTLDSDYIPAGPVTRSKSPHFGLWSPLNKKSTKRTAHKHKKKESTPPTPVDIDVAAVENDAKNTSSNIVEMITLSDYKKIVKGKRRESYNEQLVRLFGDLEDDDDDDEVVEEEEETEKTTTTTTTTVKKQKTQKYNCDKTARKTVETAGVSLEQILSADKTTKHHVPEDEIDLLFPTDSTENTITLNADELVLSTATVETIPPAIVCEGAQVVPVQVAVAKQTVHTGGGADELNMVVLGTQVELCEAESVKSCTVNGQKDAATETMLSKPVMKIEAQVSAYYVLWFLLVKSCKDRILFVFSFNLHYFY